jgi:ornithine cyclodeaminase
MIPFSEGAIGSDEITEISSVYVNEAQGRSSSAEITLYKSLGNAAQDLAAAYAIYKSVNT